MNVNENQMKEVGYNYLFRVNEFVMEKIFGASESLCVTDTYQFNDYSKYVATKFNPEEKAKRKKEVFPHDCQKAFDMGAKFAQLNHR